MLEKLKALTDKNLDKLLEVEEALVLSSFARELALEYEAFALQVPEWLVTAKVLISQEISRRVKAAQVAELRSLDAEIEGYKSASERKADAIRRREVLLAKTQTA